MSFEQYLIEREERMIAEAAARRRALEEMERRIGRLRKNDKILKAVLKTLVTVMAMEEA